MPELTIRLHCNPETGKKDLVISLRSEPDALPHEHEEQHRALVDKLIEGGLLKAGELGQVIVERQEESPVSDSPSSESTPPLRQAQGE